ncbi:MAG: type I 3-dehydroquinate dehydratase [Verrucomicrobiota bacterium]
MPQIPVALDPGKPLVVGSFGDAASLSSVSPEEARESCDLIEIRIDLLGGSGAGADHTLWQRFADIPLLFTARRGSEGGAGDLDAETRCELLRQVLPDSSLIDIEIASIPEMETLIGELAEAGIPWIGSCHDFDATPGLDLLAANRMAAANAGAAAFKAAFELGWDSGRLGELASFLSQSGELPTALMGMGPLAPVSRVLFAQLGSVLNYGYLGSTPTAPGQWSARQLKEAIASTSKSRGKMP